MKKSEIQAKEKLIIENFARVFNSIKRIDENEIPLKEWGGDDWSDEDLEGLDMDALDNQRQADAFNGGPNAGQEIFTPDEPGDYGLDENDGEVDDECFIATADRDEPGETRAFLIKGWAKHNELESQGGWDLEGPFSEQEANEHMSEIQANNAKWRYYSSKQFDDKSDYDLGNLNDFDRGEF